MAWSKEQKRDYMRKYREDPEKRKRGVELQKEWYQRNKETILEKQKKKHHSLKEDIVNKLGGKCKMCGSKDRLEFNHIDPLDKTTEASYTHVMSQSEEWKKCELLCHSCHRKYTTAENTLMRKYWLENVSLEVRRKLISEYCEGETI